VLTTLVRCCHGAFLDAPQRRIGWLEGSMIDRLLARHRQLDHSPLRRQLRLGCLKI
jgi:hypothetical protein